MLNGSLVRIYPSGYSLLQHSPLYLPALFYLQCSAKPHNNCLTVCWPVYLPPPCYNFDQSGLFWWFIRVCTCNWFQQPVVPFCGYSSRARQQRQAKVGEPLTGLSRKSAVESRVF